MAFDSLEKSKKPTGSVDKKLNELEAAINQVSALYDQYFSGVLRLEPQKENKDLQRKIQVFGSDALNTTVNRFRFQNIRSRYQQLKAQWEKVSRQIEEGTYRRDLNRLKIKIQQAEQEKKGSSEPKRLKGSTSGYEKLWESLQKKSAGGQKIPDREKFVSQIKAQVAAQRKKHPNKKVEVKLEKNAQGNVQVRLRLKDKPKK